jgi:TnpA family transposase
MPIPDGFRRLLREMLEEANRPRTRAEDAANNAAVLGVGSIQQMIEAKRRAREQAVASLQPRRRR